MNTLSHLREYTVYHFKYEEDVMRMYQYPKLYKQEIEHKAFIDRIDKFENQENVDEIQQKFSMEMLMFIANWIENHILKSDLDYKDYLNNLGVH